MEKYIVSIEGIDNSGKSTLIVELKKYLEKFSKTEVKTTMKMNLYQLSRLYPKDNSGIADFYSSAPIEKVVEALLEINKNKAKFIKKFGSEYSILDRGYITTIAGCIAQVRARNDWSFGKAFNFVEKINKRVGYIPIENEAIILHLKDLEEMYPIAYKRSKEDKARIKKKTHKAPSKKQYPTLKLKSERDIAMDFAEKVFTRFDKLVKSIILFGSTVKHTQTTGSDIDIIIVVDDASIKFTPKLVVWYREELRKLIEQTPYNRDLHINTVKLTTWWKDLSIGDPTIINILRYGETLIDFGGFFTPQKMLLEEGRIKPTPEAIYIALNRVAGHIIRSKQAEMGAIEGCYWAMVDAAQSLLMAIKVLPPSPEHIPLLLEEHFINKKLINKNYLTTFNDLFDLHKAIMHGKVKDIEGKIIDDYQNKAEEFYNIVLKLIEQII